MPYLLRTETSIAPEDRSPALTGLRNAMFLSVPLWIVIGIVLGFASGIL